VPGDHGAPRRAGGEVAGDDGLPDDQVVLESLAGTLRDYGYRCEVRRAAFEGIDELVVAFEGQGPAEGLQAQMMLLPGALDPAILQLFIAFAELTDECSPESACRFLNLASAPLPIGAFGLLEGEGTLFYRWNVPVARTAPDIDLIGWSLTMAEYLVGAFGPLIGRVGSGLAPDDARGDLVATLAAVEADLGTPPTA
jgi:hypothetical protein